MEKIRPVFKYLIVAAIVVFIIGVCAMFADIYSKIGKVEHELAHILSGHEHKH